MPKPISMTEPPKGVEKIAEGEGSAYETLQIIGGVPPKSAKVDLGWADIYITTDSEDITRIEYKSGGEDTNIGSSLPATTMGMTIEVPHPEAEGEAEPYSSRYSLSEAMNETKPYSKKALRIAQIANPGRIVRKGRTEDVDYSDRYYLGHKLRDEGVEVSI